MTPAPIDVLSSALTPADVPLERSYYQDDTETLMANKQMTSILNLPEAVKSQGGHHTRIFLSPSAPVKHVLQVTTPVAVSKALQQAEMKEVTEDVPDLPSSVSSLLDFPESLVPSESYGDNVLAVAVEQSAMDPTQMNISDLTSQVTEQEKTIMSTNDFMCIEDQTIAEESFVSEEELPGDDEEGQTSSLLTSPRLSKRKRRPPQALVTDSPPSTSSTSTYVVWMKEASSLLSRVARFKGQTNLTAAASDWFMHPVDPNEAPDYYELIKTPMDFTTIRRKLQSSLYQNWGEFNADMMLVRDNCYAYNPPGHVIRHDCDQVFAFYRTLYEQTLRNWKEQQNANGSPTTKKPRQDNSIITIL